jgi:NifU-like protein
VEEVTNFTKAGGGCGDCAGKIEALLAEPLVPLTPLAKTPKPAAKKLTNLQRMQLVAKVIDQEIRPSLQRDRGDIELVDIDGSDVIVALRGACSSCPSSQLTLKEFVEKRLQELVEPDIRVKEAS